HLVRRGTGHFVTIGSISDHVAFTGSTAYAASKFGLRGMHEVLRTELSRTGVRTTIVSPGPVDTPIWDPIDPDGRPGFTRRDAMLQAGDLAEAVLFAVTRAPRGDVTEIRLLPTVYTARGRPQCGRGNAEGGSRNAEHQGDLRAPHYLMAAT